MKLLVALGTAAILTAACTASASVSGSSVGTVKSANTVHVTSGANAGSDLQGDPDVNRVNPPIGKAGTHQVPPPPAAAAPAAAPAPPVIQDRCNGGIGNPPVAGNRGAPVVAGKRPQLPACMPE